MNHSMRAGESRRKLATGTPLGAGPGLDWTLDPDAMTVTAVIANLSEVDRDGDEYAPGAFAGNDAVLISQWQHGSWQAGLLPVGKGRITEENGLAIFRGAFLPTAAARETFATLNALGSMIQWSYGFDTLATLPTTRTGAKQRLARVDVHEVSPVLRGAGVQTRTVETAGGMTADDEVLRELARSVLIGLEIDHRRELAEIREGVRA